MSNDEPDLLCEVFGTVFRDCLGWHMTESGYRKHFAGLSDTEILTLAVQRHGSEKAEQVHELKRRHAALYKMRAEQETLIGCDTVILVEHPAAEGIPMCRELIVTKRFWYRSALPVQTSVRSLRGAARNVVEPDVLVLVEPFGTAFAEP